MSAETLPRGQRNDRGMPSDAIKTDKPL